MTHRGNLDVRIPLQSHHFFNSFNTRKQFCPLTGPWCPRVNRIINSYRRLMLLRSANGDTNSRGHSSLRIRAKCTIRENELVVVTRLHYDLPSRIVILAVSEKSAAVWASENFLRIGQEFCSVMFGTEAYGCISVVPCFKHVEGVGKSSPRQPRDWDHEHREF